MATKRSAEPSSLSDADHVVTQKCRLLLHLIDGVVPYLTPQLLRKCFPAESVKDTLLLGVAVRDTSLTPVYHNTAAKTKNGKKPRGYQFAASKVDSWILPYPRITVPSFDLQEDSRQRQAKSDVQISSTNSGNHVSVWTIHGRQSLHPDEYYAAAQGLASPTVVPLFDVPGDAKQQQAVLGRNQQWTEDWLKRQAEDKVSEKKEVWVPMFVGEDASSLSTAQLEWFQPLYQAREIHGVALVGWQGQKSVLETIQKELPATCTLTVLATSSLLQLVDAVEAGVSVVGTDLPRRWAQAKKALVVEYPSSNSDSKRQRMDETHDEKIDQDGCIHVAPQDEEKEDPRQHAWFRDKRPIVAGCSCLACTTHTRAYIYHLCCAKEMLAEILLFIHNLHHLLALVRDVEEGQDSGRLQALLNDASK